MKDQQQEIQEAIQAADNALQHLHAAKEYLRKAGNWGIWDMLGGGFLATMIKRSKMNDAQQELSSAKYALSQFASELRDVGQTVDIQIDTSGFLSFADYFFDGLVADWMVQTKIKDASRQVDDAITHVTQLRTKLQGLVS